MERMWQYGYVKEFDIFRVKDDVIVGKRIGNKVKGSNVGNVGRVIGE